jgi:hypothetical protein
MQQVIIGPLGNPLTLADLPRPGTLRWVARRKAEVVAAVEGGLLSTETACAMYTLSLDELLSWQQTLAARHPGAANTNFERATAPIFTPLIQPCADHAEGP